MRVGILIAATLFGCATETPTQTMVQLNVQPALFEDGPVEVSVEVHGEGDRFPLMIERQTVTAANNPLCIALEPRGGDANRGFDVKAEVLQNGVVVAATEHDGRFVAGALRLMPVQLQQGCVHDIDCDDFEGTTCGTSGCNAPETFAAAQLENYTAGSCGAPVADAGM